MPRTNLTAILLTAVLSMICYQRASQTRYAATVADAMSQIDTHFVEPIERRKLFESSMKGMVKELDRYSNYINPDEYVLFLQEIEQQFGGIGIVIDFDPKSGLPVVLNARPGAPAYKSGIRAGDVITAINGKDIEDLGADGPVNLIRGEPGTSVQLSIQSPGDDEPRNLTVVRAVIPIESVMGYERDENANWIFQLPDHPRIGYIWLESFGEETSRELTQALDKIEPNIDALIVDVRTNAGGILTAAVEVCDMFVPDGTIVTIRSRYASRDEDGSAGNERFPMDKPLVVLADRHSASAAEIFAACMQDYGRAIVIGQRTWGKGTVQSVFEMEGGRSALRLTTATYWRPSGTNIHRRPDAEDEDTWGVLPSEGFEIEYDDDEYMRFLRARHRRFAGGSVEDSDDEQSQAEVEQETDEENAAPFVDQQLERAIETIQAQLSP